MRMVEKIDYWSFVVEFSSSFPTEAEDSTA
jgi:hypothetical protein